MRPPRPGWVYILSHSVWSRIGGTGAVKIGKTSIDPAKRGLQIASASGLLQRPTVEWCAWVEDRDAAEAAVHQRLARYRVGKRRELFAVPVATARATIEAATTTRAVGLSRPSSDKRHRRSPSRGYFVALLIVSAGLLCLGLLH
jgi:hypothetical protein